MQEYASTSQPRISKTSGHDSKSFFKPPPQNLYMQEYSQLHSLPSPRLLVTIPSHFLNAPPKPYMQEYASTSQPRISKTSGHDSKSFFKPPPPKPYMQEYASTSQPHLLKTSGHDSKSFF